MGGGGGGKKLGEKLRHVGTGETEETSSHGYYYYYYYVISENDVMPVQLIYRNNRETGGRGRRKGGEAGRGEGRRWEGEGEGEKLGRGEKLGGGRGRSWPPSLLPPLPPPPPLLFVESNPCTTLLAYKNRELAKRALEYIYFNHKTKLKT